MKSSRTRIVEPELLDVLPPQDRRALHSRLDLRRLNQWMNHPRLMSRLLSENLTGTNSPRIAELGAGDGHFFLSVARRLKSLSSPNALLLDRLDAFLPNLKEQFQTLGWQAHTEIIEVLSWLQPASPNRVNAIISNLFLHQFQDHELAEMLRLAARSTRLLIALEPRRAWLPRFCGHFLWGIGCNSVTRNDAKISIRAGFSGHELSDLWEDKNNWELTERPVGMFSHLFVARRKN